MLTGTRRSTLIFCVDLAHVAAVTQAFRDAGIDARSVSSESQSAIRRQTLNAFMAGEFPVLVNCQVLTEAADIPCVSADTSPPNLPELNSRSTASSSLAQLALRIS
jgi:ATP-dependent helicase IRC3